jgi:hypothetical protein
MVDLESRIINQRRSVLRATYGHVAIQLQSREDRVRRLEKKLIVLYDTPSLEVARRFHLRNPLTEKCEIEQPACSLIKVNCKDFRKLLDMEWSSYHKGTEKQTTSVVSIRLL